MDEIDDALDQINVNTVAKYIGSKASDVQSIVISLKESFYEKAEALIGITKARALLASLASLPLSVLVTYALRSLSSASRTTSPNKGSLTLIASCRMSKR